jgi:hypothetical protein
MPGSSSSKYSINYSEVLWKIDLSQSIYQQNRSRMLVKKSFIMNFRLFPLVIALCGCSSIVRYPPGGYNYPDFVSKSDSDNYFLPIKNIVPRKDSLLYIQTHYLYQSFDEPNLSIKPIGADRFRLFYGGGLNWPVVITLTPDEIVVKTCKSGSPYPPEDLGQLTELERFHYRILEYRYPIDESLRRTVFKKNLDSLINLYPQLRSPAYYSYLLNKAIARKNWHFVYAENRISISLRQFKYLVNLIDSAGYWTLPYSIGCSEVANDAGGFTLEANTATKYNVVTRVECADSAMKFAMACQELVNYAHMGNKVYLSYGMPDSVRLPK